jgi:hypothetical protein
MSIRHTEVDTATSPALVLGEIISDDQYLYNLRPTPAARGIITALFLSIPIWLLFGVAAYVLI